MKFVLFKSSRGLNQTLNLWDISDYFSTPQRARHLAQVQVSDWVTVLVDIGADNFKAADFS